MVPRVRSVLVAAALLLLATPALRADQAAAGPPADPLADLADAVDAALPAAASRREARALGRAATALAGRDAGDAASGRALRRAASALERLPGSPFAAELAAAYAGVREGVDAEYADLQVVLKLFASAAGERSRGRIASRYAAAEADAAAGRIARAASRLLQASREIRRAGVPALEVFGGPLRVLSVDVEGLAEVHLNRPIVIRFSQAVDPASVRADTVQVRRAPNFAVQAMGTYEVHGPLVVFRPRLPVTADLSDAGLLPNTAHRVVLPGHPALATVLALDGKPLSRAHSAPFHTAFDPLFYFSSAHYVDAPPAVVDCTVPADLPPAAPWTGPGGATEVPADGPLRLVLSRVPLDPFTANAAEITLVMTSFEGTPVDVPVPGSVALEQDFEHTVVEFRPAVRLPDRSRFALQVSRRVMDLSGRTPIADHAARAAFSAAAALEEATNPAGPLATLRRTHERETDPRTYLVFTTRDEAAQDLEAALAFDGTDRDVDGGDGADRARSNASFDVAVPGSVAAVILVAGGDGRLGDFDPVASTTLDTDGPMAEDGVFQFRSIRVRPGVTVTLRGSRPAILRSVGSVLIEGTLDAAGARGEDAESNPFSSALPPRAGGVAGAGGGAGGTSYSGSLYGQAGGAGAAAPGGGFGGGGGFETPSTAPFSFGGGGGGGGHANPGSAGSGGSWNPASQGYNGAGGAAGAEGGTEPTSVAIDGGRVFPGAGGGGGGSGGNNHYTPFGYRTSGAGGGGGGGGLLITTAGNLRVTGTVDAGGGAGGNTLGSNIYGGAPGGGGAGGAVALFAQGTLDASGATVRAGGGAAGTNLGSAWIGAGGAGGDGFLRLEASAGVAPAALPAITTPGALSTGVYDPVSRADDAPSVFTGTWFLLPALRPEVLPFGPEHFAETTVPGASIRWEIQMAVDDRFRPGFPVTSSIDVATGDSSDPARATGWVLLKDEGGIRDVASILNGRAYQHFRVRLTFSLPDGLRSADTLPSVQGFRVPLRHRD